MLKQHVYRRASDGYRLVGLSEALNTGEQQALVERMNQHTALCPNLTPQAPVYRAYWLEDRFVLGRCVLDPNGNRQSALSHQLLFDDPSDLDWLDGRRPLADAFLSAYVERSERDLLPSLDPDAPGFAAQDGAQRGQMVLGRLFGTRPELLAGLLAALRGVGEGRVLAALIVIDGAPAAVSEAAYLLMETVLRGMPLELKKRLGYRSLWHAPEETSIFPVCFSTPRILSADQSALMMCARLSLPEGSLEAPYGADVSPDGIDRALSEALIRMDASGIAACREQRAAQLALRAQEAAESPEPLAEDVEAAGGPWEAPGPEDEEGDLPARSQRQRRERDSRLRAMADRRGREGADAFLAGSDRRRQEDDQRRAEAERRKQEEDEKLRAESERRRREQDQRRAEAERRKQEEDEKLRAESERRRREQDQRRAEAERRRREEDAKSRAEAERRKRDEDARRADAERRRKEEDAKSRADAERRKEEDARRVEAERRRKEEDAKSRADAERPKREGEAVRPRGNAPAQPGGASLLNSLGQLISRGPKREPFDKDAFEKARYAASKAMKARIDANTRFENGRPCLDEAVILRNLKAAAAEGMDHDTAFFDALIKTGTQYYQMCGAGDPTQDARFAELVCRLLRWDQLDVHFLYKDLLFKICACLTLAGDRASAACGNVVFSVQNDGEALFLQAVDDYEAISRDRPDLRGQMQALLKRYLDDTENGFLPDDSLRGSYARACLLSTMAPGRPDCGWEDKQSAEDRAALYHRFAVSDAQSLRAQSQILIDLVKGRAKTAARPADPPPPREMPPERAGWEEDARRAEDERHKRVEALKLRAEALYRKRKEDAKRRAEAERRRAEDARPIP